MPEYIGREALIEQITSKFQEHYGNTNYQFIKDFYRFVIRRIKRMPTADAVEVKHGYWYLLDECANEGVYCSVCHKKVYKTDYANQKVKSPYCPNCGAKMDGVRG